MRKPRNLRKHSPCSLLFRKIRNFLNPLDALARQQVAGHATAAEERISGKALYTRAIRYAVIATRQHQVRKNQELKARQTMRQKSNSALIYQKAILLEQKNLEETPGDYVAQSHIRAYEEAAGKALDPIPHTIVAGECLPEAIDCNENVWEPTNTLLQPNSIHQTASLDRLTLAEETGYQELCIDAADTIGANCSLEKMLAHQMAICHAEGMKLVVKAGKTRDEAVSLKMLNAATRFMEVYQKGYEAIHRAKRGNRQMVVVKYQQVNVGDGGQAVITETTGGRGKGRGDV